jgi:hypothetical protein
VGCAAVVLVEELKKHPTAENTGVYHIVDERACQISD